MQISNDFNKMIDSCQENMTPDELSFLEGYARGLVSGSAALDSMNYVAAKRFLKVFNSTVDMCKNKEVGE